MVENRGLMVLQLTHQPIQSEAKGTGVKQSEHLTCTC